MPHHQHCHPPAPLRAPPLLTLDTLLLLANPRSNPLNRNHLASPVAITGMKTMALKMAMVILSTVCSELGNAQSVLMLICVAFILYYMVTTVS